MRCRRRLEISGTLGLALVRFYWIMQHPYGGAMSIAVGDESKQILD